MYFTESRSSIYTEGVYTEAKTDILPNDLIILIKHALFQQSAYNFIKLGYYGSFFIVEQNLRYGFILRCLVFINQ